MNNQPSTADWRIETVTPLVSGYRLTFAPVTEDGTARRSGSHYLGVYEAQLIASLCNAASVPELDGQIITVPASITRPEAVSNFAVLCAKEAQKIPSWVLSLHPEMGAQLPGGAEWVSERRFGNPVLAMLLGRMALSGPYPSHVHFWPRPQGRRDLILPVGNIDDRPVNLVARVGSEERSKTEPVDIGWIGLQRWYPCAPEPADISADPNDFNGPLLLPATAADPNDTPYPLAIADPRRFVRYVLTLTWGL